MGVLYSVYIDMDSTSDPAGSEVVPAERHGGSSYNMNNKSESPTSSRTGDRKYLPRHPNRNMNFPNGHTANVSTGAYCGNTDRMPNLSKTNFEREVQRRFTNKRNNLSRAEEYEIEKRTNNKLQLKYAI